jgi:hypothetical protein
MSESMKFALIDMHESSRRFVCLFDRTWQVATVRTETRNGIAFVGHVMDASDGVRQWTDVGHLGFDNAERSTVARETLLAWANVPHELVRCESCRESPAGSGAWAAGLVAKRCNRPMAPWSQSLDAEMCDGEFVVPALQKIQIGRAFVDRRILASAVDALEVRDGYQLHVAGPLGPVAIVGEWTMLVIMGLAL